MHGIFTSTIKQRSFEISQASMKGDFVAWKKRDPFSFADPGWKHSFCVVLMSAFQTAIELCFFDEFSRWLFRACPSYQRFWVFVHSILTRETSERMSSRREDARDSSLEISKSFFLSAVSKCLFCFVCFFFPSIIQGPWKAEKEPRHPPRAS